MTLTLGGYATGDIVKFSGIYVDSWGYRIRRRRGDTFPERIGHGGGHTRWYWAEQAPIPLRTVS